MHDQPSLRAFIPVSGKRSVPAVRGGSGVPVPPWPLSRAVPPLTPATRSFPLAAPRWPPGCSGWRPRARPVPRGQSLAASRRRPAAGPAGPSVRWAPAGRPVAGEIIGRAGPGWPGARPWPAGSSVRARSPARPAAKPAPCTGGRGGREYDIDVSEWGPVCDGSRGKRGTPGWRCSVAYRLRSVTSPGKKADATSRTPLISLRCSQFVTHLKHIPAVAPIP
jgi:hypothetical protein